MSKPIITAIFCSCLVSCVALASNEPASLDHSSNAQVAYMPLKEPVVDINQASIKVLMTLHGLAEKKAQAIVEYRQAHGEFSGVDQLIAVKGIGKKLLEKLKANNSGRIACKASNT
ncbi:MAG: competence protein ComEA [Coxiellaceae bacterium]|nr:competence protein ComEA [Coxiellaceae bacterium]|tara:strand:- start:1809 stop:2156 length:348 start_codon:yes stop_codon:yes gene_type:complete